MMSVRLAILAGTVIAAAALAAPAFAEDMVRVGNPAGDDFHFSFANVGSEAGIFNDGINRGEVGVIEHIQECGPEFEIGMFAQLDVLKDGGIANILHRVL